MSAMESEPSALTEMKRAGGPRVIFGR
jgi:hypothetical protein